jgi:prefoldin subunit 1
MWVARVNGLARAAPEPSCFPSRLATVAFAMSQQMVQLELDEKDKESFQEMQTSMNQARQEIALIDATLRKRTTEKREAELILAELSTMGSDTTAYKQVGKMFLQTPIDDLKVFLDTKTERCIKECDALTEKRSHVTQAAEKLQVDFQQFVKEHIYQQQAGATA